MKKINKIITTILAIVLIMSYNITYASMADFTDEEADKVTKQEQEEWQKEQEDRINKSSDNYLQSLLVENYKITPEFDKQTINYQISEEVNEDYIEIKAETDDPKSSVSGVGKIMLNSGENVLPIEVTAENGMVRTYYIKVQKTVKTAIRLESLLLKNGEDVIEITPEFDKETFEYSCNIENYVDNINIIANTGKENEKIDIIGNENLHTGLNKILINIYNGNDKIVYKINAYKAEKNEINEENRKIDYKIIIIFAVVLLLVILCIFVKQRKRTIGKHR